MKILYVEDNLANLLLVQRLARIGNHDIISHADGESTLANFEQEKPDLVLMDIQLGGALNGLDVVKKLRENGHKTPIIALTAYAMVGDKERCLEAGCDAYLPKPLPVEQLVELFKKFDPKNGAVQTAQPAPGSSGDANAVQPTVESQAETRTPEPAAQTQPAPVETKPTDPKTEIPFDGETQKQPIAESDNKTT